MFKLKNAALATAVIMALAACGGGSDDPVVTDPVTQPGDQLPGDQNPGDQNPGDQNPGDENPGGENPGDETPGGEDPGDEDPGETPANDFAFAGMMTLSADQVLINGTQLAHSAFIDTGLYGQARGTNAPLQTVGLRVYQTGMNGQSGNIRAGFELADTASDVRIQILLDHATLTIAETGEMTVEVPPTASAYVTVSDGAGSTVNVTTTAVPADAVRFTTIPDDPTSWGLTLDVDALMAAAIAATPEAERAPLEGLDEIDGRFTMRLAFSGIDLATTTGNDLALTSPLVVAGQPPLAGGYDADTSDAEPGNGAGVEGTFYVGIEPGV